MDWTLTSIGSELYAGTSGISLFMTYLGQLTGEARFVDLARRLANGLAERMTAANQAVSHRDFTGEGLLGISGGLDGPLYALSHWTAVTGADPSLATEAFQAVSPLLVSAIDADRRIDLTGGSAGTVLMLMLMLMLNSLYRAIEDPAIRAVIMRAAERIADAAEHHDGVVSWPTELFEWRALTGASHGASGMALALARARSLADPAKATAGRYLGLIEGALRFERTRYDREAMLWPDVRPGAEGAGTTVAWCHSAPGIGLMRLALRAEGITDGVDEDLRTAVAVTTGHYDQARRGPQIRLGNLSLCHGESGNLMLLTAAAQATADPGLSEWCAWLAHTQLELARRHGWLCGVPDGLMNPGLMTGLAGIGYAMLRLAFPGQVPGVLTLDPPMTAR